MQTHVVKSIIDWEKIYVNLILKVIAEQTYEKIASKQKPTNKFYSKIHLVHGGKSSFFQKNYVFRSKSAHIFVRESIVPIVRKREKFLSHAHTSTQDMHACVASLMVNLIHSYYSYSPILSNSNTMKMNVVNEKQVQSIDSYDETYRILWTVCEALAHTVFNSHL